MKEAGPALGYNGYADAITKSPSGSYSVDDPATRAAILKLRDDPTVASAMAGVLTQSNSFKLTGMIGRRPSDSELYMAHFMGVGGAAKLIANAQDNPQASGARLFPNAAAANRPIFYDHDGRARSVSEVYAELDRRYAVAANSPATRSAMASLGVSAPVAVASATQFSSPSDNAAYLSRLPDVRGVTPVTASSARHAKPAGVPFAVSGRRSAAAGVSGGSGVVGASVASGQRIGVNLQSRKLRPAVAAVRSVQRPQRRLQRLAQPRAIASSLPGRRYASPSSSSQ